MKYAKSRFEGFLRAAIHHYVIGFLIAASIFGINYGRDQMGADNPVKTQQQIRQIAGQSSKDISNKLNQETFSGK